MLVIACHVSGFSCHSLCLEIDILFVCVVVTFIVCVYFLSNLCVFRSCRVESSESVAIFVVLDF